VRKHLPGKTVTILCQSLWCKTRFLLIDLIIRRTKTTAQVWRWSITK
jgi:hypothetical protein